MSQEKPNELSQTPQTATGAPTTDTPIASDISKEESAATSSPSVTKTAEGDVENSSDSNEPPMPPKEPIPDTTGWSPKKKSYLNLGLLILLIVIGVALILYAWELPPFTPTVQQTNNAFVKGQTTIISPQVSGYVTKVAVQDFEN